MLSASFPVILCHRISFNWLRLNLFAQVRSVIMSSCIPIYTLRVTTVSPMKSFEPCQSVETMQKNLIGRLDYAWRNNYQSIAP
jgi:hypothetical protein